MKSTTIGLRQATAFLVALALFLAITPFRLSAASDMAQTADRAPLSKSVMAATYGKLPLSFEANQGQTDKQVKFLSRGHSYALFLTPTEAVLSLKAASDQRIKKASVVPATLKPKGGSQAAVLRIRLEHANRNVKVSGVDELPGRSNYFIGNVRRSGAPMYRTTPR